MFKITPLAEIKQKKGIICYLKIFACKIGYIIEIIVILGLWILIFCNKSIFGGFTREEIITYIIIGNLIGLISNYLLHRIIANDIINNNSKLLIYKPIKYFFHIFFSGFGKNFLPFIISTVFHLLLLYLLVDNFIINFEIHYLALIALMVILAFIIEFLMAYLINLFIFWTIESSDFYAVIDRLKKIISGNYFPLSLLPPVFVSISLALPFAYSFFVPMQLYLKKMDITAGIKGIGVQIIWIIFLYIIIRVAWNKKTKKQTIRTCKKIKTKSEI